MPPKQKSSLRQQEALKPEFQINSITKDRTQTICELYALIKDDSQARSFLAALLEELDRKEAGA